MKRLVSFFLAFSVFFITSIPASAGYDFKNFEVTDEKPDVNFNFPDGKEFNDIDLDENYDDNQFDSSTDSFSDHEILDNEPYSNYIDLEDIPDINTYSDDNSESVSSFSSDNIVFYSSISSSTSESSDPARSAAYYADSFTGAASSYEESQSLKHLVLYCKNGWSGNQDVYFVYTFPSDYSSNIYPYIKSDGLYDTSTGFVQAGSIVADVSCVMVVFKPSSNDYHWARFEALWADTHLCYSDVPIYDESGNVVDSGNLINWNISCDDSHNCIISVSSALKESVHGSFGVYNNKSEPCEATRISYSPVDDNCGFEVSENNSFSFSFNLDDFKDSCRDKKSYTSTIYVAIFFRSDSSKDGFVEFDLENLDGESGLFSDKKDYLDYPDIMDYMEDFPPFPEWDSEHPWESIWNIVKWVGECILVLGHNFIGFFKWLWECLKITIQNLGIMLYNLVVDIRRLLIYLFVPSKVILKKSVEEKCPIFSDLILNFKNAFYSNADFEFDFFGQTHHFNLRNYFSDNTLSIFRSVSNLIILSTLIFCIYSLVKKLLFVGSSSDGGD